MGEVMIELRREGVPGKDLARVAEAAAEVRTAAVLLRAVQEYPILMESLQGASDEMMAQPQAESTKRGDVGVVARSAIAEVKKGLEEAIANVANIKKARSAAVFVEASLAAENRFMLLRAMDNADTIGKGDNSYIQLSYVCGCGIGYKLCANDDERFVERSILQLHRSRRSWQILLLYRLQEAVFFRGSRRT